MLLEELHGVDFGWSVVFTFSRTVARSKGSGVTTTTVDAETAIRVEVCMVCITSHPSHRASSTTDETFLALGAMLVWLHIQYVGDKLRGGVGGEYISLIRASSLAGRRQEGRLGFVWKVSRNRRRCVPYA